MNRKLAAGIAFALLSLSAQAADMGPRRRLHPAQQSLSPEFYPLVDRMAHARAIADVCRSSDGAVMNRAFWEPLLSTVPDRQKRAFNRAVQAATGDIESAVDPRGAPLWCDDRLDELANGFPATVAPPLGAGLAAQPVCWSDPTGAYGCPGIGYDDPLAGVDPIVDGY